MAKKIIVTESQLKRYLNETAIYDSSVKQVMNFLSNNYKQSLQEESNGTEFTRKNVVTKLVDDSTIKLSNLLDYLESEFRNFNKEFLKQCIIDWYNGAYINNKGRLSKNVAIFESKLGELNEDRLSDMILTMPKTVYRGGEEGGSDRFGGVVFYTDSERVAEEYGDGEYFEKKINFKKPLVLVSSLNGLDSVNSKLKEILGDDYYKGFQFPQSLNNQKIQNKLFAYAKLKGYDGIIMNDTDMSGRNIIISYIDLYPQKNGNKLNESLNEHVFDPNKIFSGSFVNQHIKNITPDGANLPIFFMDNLIKPRKFKLEEINLIHLLRTDPSFKEYFDSKEERYDADEVNPEDLHNELVVVDGELLDGYSRASALLRDGEDKAIGFVAIKDDGLSESLNESTSDKIIAYHGSDSKFTSFNDSKPIFFTNNPEIAKTYGKHITKAELTLHNPIEFDFGGKSTIYFYDKNYLPSELAERLKEISDDIKNHYSLDEDLKEEMGYHGFNDLYGDLDGIIMNNIKDSFDGVFSTFEAATNYVVFDKNQIKVIGDGLNESVNYKNVDNNYQPLFDSFVNFCSKQLNSNFDDISIGFKKGNNKYYFGDVSLQAPNNITLYSEVGTRMQLNALAHELTHTKQVNNGELYLFKSDLAWNNGEFYLPIKDYNNILKTKNYEEYKSLPWEQEAYHNGELLPKLYKDSEEFTKLKEEYADNPTINFILDNLY